MAPPFLISRNARTVERMAATAAHGKATRQSTATASCICTPPGIVAMCHHMATAARDATQSDASEENSVRRMRRGAQVHSSLFHADERVREMAPTPGIKDLAERVGPLKTKAGEIEGWPETLNRMDCSITSTLWVCSYRQT